MNILDYAKKLGIEVPSATAKAVDAEAGKAGYEKYLADVEAATTARNNAIEAEKAGKSWWDKASDFILQSNQMSATMRDNAAATGFNQAVEAYKNMPADNKPKDDWTDDERWAFGEKYATNTEDAYAFAKDLNSRKAKEQKQKQQEALDKWASRNGVNRNLSRVASLGLNATFGSLGYLDALAQKSAGREVEQNVLLPHEAAATMQSSMAKYYNDKYGTIREDIPVIGGKGLGDVHNLGMSIAQSTLSGLSGSSASTLAQFFGMAASQGVTDALSRGATGDQAIAFGTVSGLAEAIPEMLSMDKILGIASAEGVQNLFKNILKQAGEEAGEEFTTSLITNVADNWIMGGKSQFYQTVNQLVASGMSEEEAKKKAWIQTIEDIAFDTISGALSGATTGAGATIVNRANQMNDTAANDLAKQILAPEQSKLIEDAKQYDTTKKRASALEKKVADGKELSGYELRMLSSQLNEAKRTKDVDTVRKAIVEQMKTEGVSEAQAKVLGEIALNKAIGNDVSKVQELMLKRNAAAMKVYNQISAEVMESGIGESEWAEKTPIQRLRTEKKASEMISDVKTQPVSGAKLEQVKGKYTEVDGKITFKKNENSRIHIDGITSSLTADDIAELSAIEKIANELGIDIHVYETTIDEKGQRTYTDKTGKKLSDSGYYDPNDNSIHIDLHAGNNGEGTMLYTASHEVVHFIKENAPEHYDALEALVTKELVKGGFSMEKAIEVQRNKATENGQTLTDEQLREEVIAEACQSFLASKSAVVEIKALKTKNKGLWTALKKFFTTLFTKLNKVYKTVDPDSIEGKYIASMRKAVKPIRDAFMEGAVEAGKKANAKTTTTEKTTAKEVKSQARVTSEQDAAYLDAVKRGDMETAQKMVDEAAEKAFSESKIRLPDGKLRTVYHGTNTGDFTVFNPDFIGMSSGDDGFFGMGFYFAYSKGEAKYYGAKRIISAYLDLKNPFDFETELQKYKGEKASGGNAPDAVALMNFADKFEDVAKDITIGVVEQDSDTVKEISLAEFSKAFKDVIENKKFEYSEITNEYGEKETLVTADPKTYEYEYNGEKHTYKDYSFQKRFWGKPNSLDVAYEYLASSVYRYIDMIRRTRLILDHNRAFTAALKEKGYDGAIQSQLGDEAVAFSPEQIKSADPVTYDDNGDVIPLSERFNPEKKDIRYKVRNIVGKSGKSYGKGVYLDSTLLTGLTDEERVQMVKEYIKELGGSVFTAYDDKNKQVDIHIVDSHRKFRNEKGKKVPVNKHLMNYLDNPIKQEAIALIDELILTANYSTSEVARHKHGWLDDEGKNSWDVWTTYLQDKENTVWKANLQIANSVNGEKILYEIHPIEKVEGVEKIDTASTAISISQTPEVVNPENKVRSKSRTRTYSQGQAAAMKANLNHQKVYTKSTAMKFVKAVAPGIKTKAFDELSNELWIGLNTYTAIDDKQAFAKDMADMIVDRMLVDTEVKNSKWDEAVEKIAYLKPAINTIKFREEDLPDLEHMLDKSGLRSLRARWGYKSKEGEHKRAYGLDEFITDLSREMPGMAYLADMHPAEAMVEVDTLYRELKETISQRYESAYEDATEEQIERWKSTVEGKILDVYEYYGGMSKLLQATSSTSEAVDTYLGTVPEGTEKPEKYFVDILKQMDERISFWKAEKSKTEKISRWNGIIANKALEIRDFKNGAFLNATQYHPDVFKNSIEQLTKVQWRGNISPKGVRKTFAELKQWYSMDNPMLYDKNDKENDNDLYSDVIAFYIDELSADADVGKPLTAEEYPMIYEVMNHLYTLMKNYGKIFRAGRWIDAAEIAKAYIGIIDENDNKRTAWTRAQSLYYRQFLEPMALAKQADNYNPNGFFTQTMQELRQASIDASVGEMKLRKEYDKFVNENQKYLMKAAKETVKYRGYDIPRLHLISLYMTMKRKQSREGLALNGFEYSMKTKWWDSENVVKVPGYISQSDKYDMDLINRATEEQMRIIERSFTDTDRQYIAVLERLFNEKLRKMKIDRDMERQGYTNALEGYYYPIIRGGIAKNVDTAKFTDVNRSTNSSFNKSTQQHAQQYLKIISADAMINRHIKDMCKYYYMSQAIENYNVLYHIDSDKDNPNRNNPWSISERLKTSKVWEKDFDYFKKLVADIQGIRDNVYDTDGWRLIETIRGNYAKFALGLNAKVLFTQVSSVIAAGNVIGFGTIMSINKNVGFVATKEDIENYCPIAAVRSYEQTALKAMTLSDKIGKVSEKMMLGISVMDDLVIRRLFAACQIEAKKRGEGEVGSEENKIAAGKILEQIIIETQQNSYATEKSSAMRSANPLWRGLTMFTADGMKIFSRIHEAAGELKIAKNSGDAVAVKKAQKKLARSIAVAVSISVYLAMITNLFNWIYDRDEEDKEDKPIKKLFNFTLDVVGNFIGALPFISDLYDRIVNGFEVEDVAYDTFNNVFGSLSNLWKDATDMVDGKKDRNIEDLNRDLRSLLYAVGQLTGMPVRNVYNLTRGVIGTVSPKSGYYIDSKFNDTNLVNDLNQSIKEGHENKTSYIMSLIYDERLDERVSKEQSREILRLYEKINKKEIEGYTVIPKDIPDKIKRDGVEIELSNAQKQEIADEYSKVVTAIDKLISSSFYQSLSNNDKAYMIDYYHDKYYEMAVNKALSITDKNTAIYNAIGFRTYARLAYTTKDITSDKDKNANTIAGSKKEKVIAAVGKTGITEEKRLLYIASLGYKLTDAEQTKLIKYLNSLGVGASTKKKLAELCGFEYKNGKISP